MADNSQEIKEFCICDSRLMSVFDIEPSYLHVGYDRCLKCGKIVDKDKSELILMRRL